MTTQSTASPTPPSQWLRRFVNVEPTEIAALLASFAMFFALLSAYYIVRPVRDEIGVTLGKDALHHLFTIVFVVMVVLVPLFGFVAARFPRRLVLPAIYIFFALDLIGFWLAMSVRRQDRMDRGNVFRLGQRLQPVRRLAVLELDVGTLVARGSEAALRIHFRGRHGGCPRRAFAHARVGQARCSRRSAARFGDTAVSSSMVADLPCGALRPVEPDRETDAAGGGILDGAVKVFTTPIFARIALFVFIANIVGTFFYLEQARLVASADPGQRRSASNFFPAATSR